MRQIFQNLFIRSLQVKDRIENLTRKFWEIMEWKNGETEVRDGFFSSLLLTSVKYIFGMLCIIYSM